MPNNKRQSFVNFSGNVDVKASAEDGKLPSFTIDAYSGTVMSVSGFYNPIIVDLGGLKASRSEIPILLDHDISKIVGQGTAKVESSGVTVSGNMTATTGEAGKVAEHAKNGFKWQASIGAEIIRREFLEAGKKAIVNGREVTGPILIARESVLKEVSFVAIGADDSTSAVVAASFSGAKAMTFEQWIEAKGFKNDALSEDQKTVLKASFDLENKPKDVAPEPKKVEASGNGLNVQDAILATRNEATRIANINRICASHADIAAKAISEGWDVEKAELHVLRASGAKAPAAHIGGGQVASEDIIQAAMCQSLKIDCEKEYSDQILQAAHTQFRGRIGLQQVMITAAAQNGMPVRVGERIHNGNIRQVLKYAFSDVQAAATFSLSGILSNVANKQLLQGYMEEDQNWREIAQIKSVSDFKANTSYRMLDNMEYEEVGANGEIKLGAISEESYTNQAKTYAKMFALNRTQIINDDLGAFDDLRSRIGRGASRKFNRVFWLAFMNNSTFFTTARTNYIEGSTTNLGTDGVGLGLAAKAYMERKTPLVGTDTTSQVMLGGEATKLLVPSALKTNAEILYKNTNLAAVKGSDANIHAGKYRPITVVQLGDSSYANYSTTAFYLFGDAYMPMCVSFLNGQETPTVEVSEADFDTLGIVMRGYHDFGCDKSEYLAGIKSKGAA